MELLCKDHQLNISKAYLRPGFAFGGSCLPKDLRAVLYMAKMNDVDVPVLAGFLPSNQLHVDRAANLLLNRRYRHIGVVGLSFKSGTDDLRESPLVTLVETLICDSVEEAVSGAEALVIGLSGEDIEAEIFAPDTDDQIYLDLVGFSGQHQIKGEYMGICW